VADECGGRVRCVAAGTDRVIRVDAAWLTAEPFDMRAGTDTALARAVGVFGQAKAHHAYLFANRRASRMKVLIHDGFGRWLRARRLHRGSFVWAASASGTTLALSDEQLRALVVGLPWQRLGDLATIRVL
jgi:transposase